MKKLIAILALVLILVYAALSVLGAGGEYAAEKLLYRAAKNNAKVALNPDVTPPALIASIERDFKLLIKKYPGTKAARTAHIALMEFYVNDKKYDEALNFSAVIDSAYKGDAQILSMATFLRGTAYEKTNRWKKALAEFEALKEKYPGTQLGMQIPIYIGKYYESKGLESEARGAYQDAARFYAQLARENSNKMLGYTASVFLIQAYLNLGDYESAGKTLDDVLHKYASDMSFAQLAPLVEKIYVENLKSSQKALDIYKYALSNTKDLRLQRYIKKRIAALSVN